MFKVDSNVLDMMQDGQSTPAVSVDGDLVIIRMDGEDLEMQDSSGDWFELEDLEFIENVFVDSSWHRWEEEDTSTATVTQLTVEDVERLQKSMEDLGVRLEVEGEPKSQRVISEHARGDRHKH